MFVLVISVSGSTKLLSSSNDSNDNSSNSSGRGGGGGGAYTTTRPLPGSILWMPPEVMTSKNDDIQYQCESDVYSIGVVLYEMITGKLPYRGLLPVQIVFQVAMKIINLSKHINTDCLEDVPDFFKTLVRHCTAFNINERPSIKDLSTKFKTQIKRLTRLP